MYFHVYTCFLIRQGSLNCWQANDSWLNFCLSNIIMVLTLLKKLYNEWMFVNILNCIDVFKLTYPNWIILKFHIIDEYLQFLETTNLFNTWIKIRASQNVKCHIKRNMIVRFIEKHNHILRSIVRINLETIDPLKLLDIQYPKWRFLLIGCPFSCEGNQSFVTIFRSSHICEISILLSCRPPNIKTK